MFDKYLNPFSKTQQQRQHKNYLILIDNVTYYHLGLLLCIQYAFSCLDNLWMLSGGPHNKKDKNGLNVRVGNYFFVSELLKLIDFGMNKGFFFFFCIINRCWIKS